MVRVQLRARGIRDQRVLEAMEDVPRHEFVPEDLRRQAYDDHPLPIGEEQTISQPFIVALMLQELALEADFRVLEIGTGSGYQTAVLCRITAQVFTMERHPVLARRAEATLVRLGFRNMQVVTGDGVHGLPQHAPYQAIIVSAAAAAIPPALFEQLTEGGRMVIPVGPAGRQEIQVVRKAMGHALVRTLDGCRCVPLGSGDEGT